MPLEATAESTETHQRRPATSPYGNRSNVISDLDIYRTTTLLVDRHGVDPATRPADSGG